MTVPTALPPRIARAAQRLIEIERTPITEGHQPARTGLVSQALVRRYLIGAIRQDDLDGQDLADAISAGHVIPGTKRPVRNKRELRDAIASHWRYGDTGRAFLKKRASELNARYLLPKSGKLAASALGPPRENPPCPTCGTPLYQPDAPPAFHDFITRATSGAVRQSVHQATSEVDPVRWVITTLVQAPDIAHTVAVEFDSGTLEEVEVIYPRDVVRQMAEDFLANLQNDAISLHHDEDLENGVVSLSDAEHGVVVQSAIAPVCFDLGDRHFPEGCWYVAFHAKSVQLRQAILDGEVGAISLVTNDCEMVPITD